MTFFIGLPEQLAKASPARWDRALERARLAQVRIRRTEDDGVYRVTSASRPGISYDTDGFYCTCDAAGSGDPVCLHRAAVRAALASTIDPQPEPPAPAAVPSERERLYKVLDTCNAILAARGRLSAPSTRGSNRRKPGCSSWIRWPRDGRHLSHRCRPDRWAALQSGHGL